MKTITRLVNQRVKGWKVVTSHMCILGESPVWDARNRRILWVDITEGRIHQFFPENKKHKATNIGQMIGAICLTTSGGLIAALQNGFATVDLEKGTIRHIEDPEVHLPGNRFNDGKCDPKGRFWAGTMAFSNKANAGSVYVLEQDLSVSLKIKGVSCSNGMAWSPDHTTFYYIDTPTRKVVAYDFDIAAGAISNRRTVINFPESEGYPDGMTIDTDGMLWIAMWDGWKVTRYDPATGELIQSILLPVAKVTSCVFGGENLQDLYITTARAGLTNEDLYHQPLAGCLFVAKKTGSTGMMAYEFNNK
ncbi:MAG TPA: SMP-30/gluconolactonase/LRE family protein [Pedobacter sp.]|uniref:SMP-30/gluconolactonase/LRE family protein n=1 Tax=Pedobacter sp. TaxID=1411316 RepID=UPI002BF8CE00|nr:SMP-30/gluconolactonase/LRE family protein [Pedobacter sp.]HMI01398.1 SMP-30/gluconolactonase/LRE family protein [Pedobacter sp.]